MPRSVSTQISLIAAFALFLATAPQLAIALDRELLGEDCYEILHERREAAEQTREACRAKLTAQPVLVVTPTGRETSLLTTPASVTAVTAETIERTGAFSVADALRDVPGIEVTDSGQPGLLRIRIRGEESRRVAILIDGQEFADEREVGTPLLLAPELIERIEVLRGTASVLHGSRAIGGVINIITKRGGYHPIQASSSVVYDSATDGFREMLSLFGRVKEFGYRVSGTNANHQNRESADGEVEDTAYDNESYSVGIGRDSGDHSFWVSSDRFNASSDVYVEPEVRTAPPFLDFQIDAPQRDRAKTAIFYDWRNVSPILSAVHADGYFQKSERQFDTFSQIALELPMGPVVRESSIFSDSTLTTLGTNVTFDLTLLDQHATIVGFKLTKDELDQNRTEQAGLLGIAPSESINYDSVEQLSTEVFLQDEWTIAPAWVTTLGARGYVTRTERELSTRANLTDGGQSGEHAIGVAGIKYLGVSNLNIYGNWSQGYVTPSMINLATGAFAGPSFVSPNENLKSETSNGLEVGVKFDDGVVSIEGALFHVWANDYIDHVLCSTTTAQCLQPTSARDRVYANIEEARTFGAEATVKVQGTVSPYLTTSWLRRRFSSPEGSTYDTGLPPISSRIGMTAERAVGSGVIGWADLYLRAASSAREQLSPNAVEQHPGWGTLNLSLGADYGLKRDVRATLDLLNLGDKGYTHATESVPAVGRSAIIKLSFDF